MRTNSGLIRLGISVVAVSIILAIVAVLGGCGGGGGSAPPSSVDTGRSVSQLIHASAGGKIALPDGASLDIPASALSADTTIKVTVPTSQSAASPFLIYHFEPAGLRLSSPATVTFGYAPGAGGAEPLISVFESSTLNPVQDAGSEKTNWIAGEVTARDTVAHTVSVHLVHFTFLYVGLSVDRLIYLVTDIPGKYLQAGDCLFTLTTLSKNPGADWNPGHVGVFVGSVPPATTSPDGMVEADGLAVVANTKDGMAGESGHSYLGPRRVRGGLTSAEQSSVAAFAVAQIGKGYSLIGDQSLVGGAGSKFSCVGLCQAALNSVGKSPLSWFERLAISSPIELFWAMEAVPDITVDCSDTVTIPVTGVVMDHRSPSFLTSFRGYYSRREPYTITTTNMPPNATFSPAAGGGYLFTWTPGPGDVGKSFTAAWEMRADVGGYTQSASRSLTIKVSSKACPPSECTAATGPTPGGYSVLDLTQPGLTAPTTPAAINSFGQVLGDTFLWTPDLKHGTTGTFTSTLTPDMLRGGTGFNDLGKIVGDSYLWTPTSVNGTTGSRITISSMTPVAINSAGLIAGNAYVAGKGSQAALYSGGTVTLIGTLQPDSTDPTKFYGVGFPYAINSRGDVAGVATAMPSTNFPYGETHAFLYTGSMTDLDKLPGAVASSATALNDLRSVVGTSTFFAGGSYSHATLWSGGAKTDLGTLGGAGSSAESINASGVIVGSSNLATGEQHAFIYSAGKMVDLNTLIGPSSGWVLTDATGINDCGQIVGTGMHNRLPAGFLLIAK